MNEADALDIMQFAIWTVLTAAGPSVAVAMLVGSRDPVIPQRIGRRLYDAYDGPKRLWEFPEGNHGTVMLQPPEIWKQIIDFLQTNHPHS